MVFLFLIKTLFCIQTYPLVSLKQFQVVRYVDQYLSELTLNNELAVAVSREQSLARTQTGLNLFDPKNNIFCFGHPNTIHEYSVKMLAQKNFALLNELNRFIRYASGGGLIQKWLKKYRFSEEKKPQFQYSPFSPECYLVLMVLFCCMMLSAIFVITIEWTINKKVKEGKYRKCWRIAEIAIDQKRYFCLHDFSFK